MVFLNCETIENYNRLAVAVSGGGDSLALLILMDEWAKPRKIELFGVTLDHGLRTTSAAEARMVHEIAQKNGISHDILKWENPIMQGNLSAQARKARYQLIGQWALNKRLQAVCLGHNADDIAETFLMRLARGSGSDGLASMLPVRESNGMIWLRPLLHERRQNLRHFLSMRGLKWCDDPFNEDVQFERARMRKLVNILEKYGVAVDKITQTAQNLRRTTCALSRYAQAWIKKNTILDYGEIHLPKEAFYRLEYETRLRILSGVIKWLAQRAYAPRGRSVAEFLTHIPTRKRATLGGCIIQWCRDDIIVTREMVRQPHIFAHKAHNRLYDDLWHIKMSPEFVKQAAITPMHDYIAPIGAQGLCSFGDWRACGLSRYGAMATPGLWRDGRLIAAPVLEKSEKFTAIFRKDAYASLYFSFNL